MKASLQRLRRLSRRRSARSDEGAYVIDGPTLLTEALDSGVALVEVLAEPNCPDDIVVRAEAAGAVVHRVSSGALAKAVETVNPQPVAAIAQLPDLQLDAALDLVDDVPLVLVLVGVNDPGNAGTLLRSAEAAGAQLVVFSDRAVDPYNPKCVRAAAGSLFRLAVVRSAATPAVLDALGGRGVQTVGTAAAAPGVAPYDEIDWTGPSAVLLGNEAHGLDPALAGRLDALATIPMAGPVESLNVGMAGTLVCFEALRQRRAANRLDGAGAPKAG